MRPATAGLWMAFGYLVSGAAPVAEPLRVRGLVLVDDEDHEVGRWVTTPTGVELVVGGEAQVSLVTDGGSAAVNVLADDPAVRTVSTAAPE